MLQIELICMNKYRNLKSSVTSTFTLLQAKDKATYSQTDVL